MATQSKTMSALPPSARLTCPATSGVRASMVASAPRASGPLALGRVRVGADDLARAVRAEHREGEQSDGAGPENGDGPAGDVPGQADRVHRRRQRLDQRRGVIVERLRHGMQAVRGQGEVVRHAALSVAAAEELQVLAQVLASGGAHLARPAGQVGLHDDPLSRRAPGGPSMTPTTSWPGRYGSETNGWRPWAACRSDPHTPATSVRTRASSGPGAGMSAASTAIRPG